MAQRKQVFVSRLNGGEISADLTSRVDLEKYQGSLTDCENFVPQLQGGLKRRRSTRFVGKVRSEYYETKQDHKLYSDTVPGVYAIYTLYNVTKVQAVDPVNDLDPLGTYQAMELTESNDASPLSHYVSLYSNTVEFPSASAGVVSFYVKKHGGSAREWVAIQVVRRDGSLAVVYFHLNYGTVGTVTGFTPGSEDYGIEAITNAWFRIWARILPGSGTEYVEIRLCMATADGATAYQGNGGSKLLVWGFSLGVSQADSATPYPVRRCRLIPYSPNDTDQFLLELTDRRIRIWKDDQLVHRESTGIQAIFAEDNWGSIIDVPPSGWNSVGATVKRENPTVLNHGWYISISWQFYVDLNSSGGVSPYIDKTSIQLYRNKYYKVVIRARTPDMKPFGASVFLRGDYLGYVGGERHTAGINEWQDYVFYYRSPTTTTGTLSIKSLPTGRIHIDTVTISECYPLELESPWLEADLEKIQFAQYGYSMYLAHPDYGPRRIVMYGYDDWTITDLLGETAGQPALRPPPTFEDVFTFTTTLTLGAVTGTSVTATAGAAIFNETDEDRMIVFRDAKAVIRSVVGNGVTTATVDIITDFPQNILPSGEWGMQGSPQGSLNIGSGEGSPVNSIQTWDQVTNPSFRAASSAYAGDVGKYIRVPGDTPGLARILSFDATTVTVQIIRPCATGATTQGWTLEESAWSVNNGYPAAVAFHEQRLWLGGTARQPQTMWGSTIASFEDFFVGANADDAVAFTLVSEQTAQIRWLASQRNMVAGTSLSEFRIEGSPETGITATTPPIIRQETAYGGNHVQPLRIGNSIVFWDNTGTKMIEYAYDYEGDSYKGKLLNVYTRDYWVSDQPEFTWNRRTTKAHAYFRGKDVDVIWVVVGERTSTSDSKEENRRLYGVVYNREHEMAAWFHSQMGSYIADVCVIPSEREDLLYFCEYYGGGLYLLRYDSLENGFADFAIRYLGGAVSSLPLPAYLGYPTATVSVCGYETLSTPDQALRVAPYNVQVDDKSFSGNTLILSAGDGIEFWDYLFGWEYDSDFVPVPIEIQSEDGGTTMDRKKRIVEIILRASGYTEAPILANDEEMVEETDLGEKTGASVSLFRSGDEMAQRGIVQQVDIEIHSMLYAYIYSLSVVINFGEGP